VVQTTSLVTSIRYSVTLGTEGSKHYFSTTAVFWMEFIKLVAAVLYVFYERGASVVELFKALRNEVASSHKEILKLAVPSLLYTLQNNILYVAIENLDAPTYQVLYNAKILTTGVFAVTLLGKRLSRIQWMALVLLVVGCSFAQYVPSSGDAATSAAKGNRLVGLAAVGVACVTSGFAGVYFEKVLKSSSTSLWIRNIQMSLSSVPLALLSVWYYDGANVAREGFNYGYTPMVWQIVFNQAVGGLLIAVVIKYADNLLKAFAAAISIISSSLLAFVFFDFLITPTFVVGSSLVLFATYVYSSPDVVSPYVPLFLREAPKPPIL